jgi:hypothetical protein
MFRRLIVISSISAALVGSTAMAQVRAGRAGKAAGLRPKVARQLRANRGKGGALEGRNLTRLQQRLNLNDTQMSGIRSLEENRRKDLESLRQEMAPKRQQLRDLLKQGNPNPNDVGSLMLQLRQDERQRTKDINQRFTSGVQSLLTPEQLQKLPKKAR